MNLKAFVSGLAGVAVGATLAVTGVNTVATETGRHVYYISLLDAVARQPIPSDGKYYLVIFPTGEGYDPHGMHVGGFPNASSSQIRYAASGDADAWAYIHWDRKIDHRIGFVRNPLTAPDTTGGVDKSAQYLSTTWFGKANQGETLAVRVRNLSGATRYITHAQFKIKVHT